MMNNASGKHTFAQEPIVLENPMKGYRKWYHGLIPVSCIAFMICRGLGFGLFIGFIIGWALAYMIVNGIAGVKLLKLNFANHPMSALITTEQLYEGLGTFVYADFIVGLRIYTIYFTDSKENYRLLTTKRLRRKFA